MKSDRRLRKATYLTVEEKDDQKTTESEMIEFFSHMNLCSILQTYDECIAYDPLVVPTHTGRYYSS